MRKIRWSLMVVSCVALVLGLFLPMTRDAGAQTQNVLKIGSLIPFMIKEGVEMKKWHELFVKMINEKGGLTIGGKTYTIQWFNYDVGYNDSAKTLACVQKAIHQDGVRYLIDNFGDVYNLTVVHTEQNKVLYFGVGFGNETVSTKNQLFFRPLGGFYISGTNYLIASDFVKKGAKTGVVCTVDSEMGRVAGASYGGADAMAGLAMQPPVFFGMDTVDFGPVATKVKSLNVDMVDFGVAVGDQVVNLISALKDAGWKGYIFPGAAINPTTFANIVKRVGPYFDGSEMIYSDPRGIPAVTKDPEMRAYIDQYTKEYGEFHTEGCLWLGNWFFFLDALKATNSVEPTVLANYLAKGPKAPLTMVGYAQLFARPDIGQYRTVDGAPAPGRGVVQNGKLEYIGQITVKDQYLATIKFHKLQDVYQKYWDQYGKPKFPPETATLDFADITK